MGLESIIAQRIAAASQARERLYDPAAVGSSLGQWAQSKAMDARQTAAGATTMAAEAEANAGVPEPVARLLADNLIPPAPDAPGTGLPIVGADAGAANRLAADQRRGKVDALVSALGAAGGAKLLAKMAMYTGLFNANNRDALGRLKLGADLADGTLGKPPAAPRSVGGGGGGGGGITADRDAAVKNFLATYGGNPDQWGEEAWTNLPPSLAGSMLKERGVKGRAAGTDQDRDRDFEYRKQRDLKLDYDKQQARESGDYKAWASIVEQQISNIDKEINRLEVYETDFNGKVKRKIEGSTEYYNKLLQDRQDKVKELEAIKGEFVPPVPGASPPVGGARTPDAKGQYQWIGGESGTDIVITDTPTPPGANFKPYDPPTGATKQTTTISDFNAPPRLGDYTAPVGEPKRVDTSLPRAGEPKRVEAQIDADIERRYDAGEFGTGEAAIQRALAEKKRLLRK